MILRVAKVILLSGILINIVFLVGVVISRELSEGILYRMIVFLIEHIIMFSYLTLNELNPFDLMASCNKTYSFIGIILLNFLLFGVSEIYLETAMDMPFIVTEGIVSHQGPKRLMVYLYVFYNLNLFLGVCSLIAAVSCFLYKVQTEMEEQRRQELLRKLEPKQYEVNQSEQDCSICLYDIKQKQICYKLDCAHIFHTQCLINWIKYKKTCPLCRNKIFSEEDFRS